MQKLQRYQGLIKIASIVGIIVALFLIMRTMPVGPAVVQLESIVESLGIWGPIAFAGAYIIAAVAFVPGLPLTLAAGAVFGLLWGTVTVSIASTVAAAVSFIIGRYLARSTVQAQAAKFPKFAAVDRAIGNGGWRIVLMLRLVPVFPYSAGNYLLGLTPVRFWSYVLASWVGMMPATVVYVYFGHLGRVGVEAAASGVESGRGPLEWTLLIIGLLAAIAVTAYVTHLTQRALAEQTELEPDATDETKTEAEDVDDQRDEPAPQRNVRITMSMAGTALALLILGACATLNPDWLSRFFGPPAVAMTEAYTAQPDGPTFDHTAFDRIVKAYVSDNDGGGWVDYAALAERDRDALQAYIQQIGDADFEALGRDEKLALLINAYNAFTLELILEHFQTPDGNRLQSIMDIPAAKRWKDERWRVGEHVWSLDQIEHEQIRPKFKEPRIHWALVCAAVGCPPLRSEAFTGERLDAQLHDQGSVVHRHERWYRYDRENGRVHLAELYKWYGGDFEQTDGGILEHAARFDDTLRADLEAGQRPDVRWITYDWSLNHRDHVQAERE